MTFRSPEQFARDEPSLIRRERTFNKRTVQEWLAGAVAKLEDARRSANSGPTRMDAAYDVQQEEAAYGVVPVKACPRMLESGTGTHMTN